MSFSPLFRTAALSYVGHPFQGWALSAAGNLRHPGEDVFRPYHQRKPAAGVCCHVDATPESDHSRWWVHWPRLLIVCLAVWRKMTGGPSNMFPQHQVPASWTELWLSTTSCLPANSTTTSLLKNSGLCWKSHLPRWLFILCCGLCCQEFHYIKSQTWVVCTVGYSFAL